MSEPIEQPDNNFIALRKVSAGNNMLYAEFQNGTDGNVDFHSPMHYELFDMAVDPWRALLQCSVLCAMFRMAASQSSCCETPNNR